MSFKAPARRKLKYAMLKGNKMYALINEKRERCIRQCRGVTSY
uniref:Uncharacterized protein n=1 Tax=Ciona intestinalis TaxID=7719 RepID=F6WQC6_CIOIN